jgi:hypothetical protein
MRLCNEAHHNRIGRRAARDIEAALDQIEQALGQL